MGFCFPVQSAVRDSRSKERRKKGVAKSGEGGEGGRRWTLIENPVKKSGKMGRKRRRRRRRR